VGLENLEAALINTGLQPGATELNKEQTVSTVLNVEKSR
jgi:hypothetical protein